MTNNKTIESPTDILWVRNENGGVHDVTREFADLNLYETTNSGNRFLLPGWSFISEDEAHAGNPQLFGVPDPTITYTEVELRAQVEHKRLHAELHADSE